MSKICRQSRQFFCLIWSVTTIAICAGAVVNVREYGAKCDLSADDTMAVTNALAATPDFGTFLVPQGCKLKVTQVKIYNREGIKFLGESATGNSSDLGKQVGGFYYAGADGGTLIDLQRSRGLVFEGLGFYSATDHRMADAGQAGVLVEIDENIGGNKLVSDLIFRRNSFSFARKNARTNAVYISRVSRSNVEDLRFYDNRFVNYGTAIHIAPSANAKNFEFIHNWFEYGIQPFRAEWGSFVLRNNYFSVNDGTDVWLTKWSDPIEIAYNLTEGAYQFLKVDAGAESYGPIRVIGNNFPVDAPRADTSKCYVDLGTSWAIFQGNHYDNHPNAAIKPFCAEGGHVLFGVNSWAQNANESPYTLGLAVRSITRAGSFEAIDVTGNVLTFWSASNRPFLGRIMGPTTGGQVRTWLQGTQNASLVEDSHLTACTPVGAPCLGDGELEITGLPRPGIKSVTGTGTAGAKTALQLAAKDATGRRTLLSDIFYAAVPTTLDDAGYVTVTAYPVAGASGYDVLAWSGTAYALIGTLGANGTGILKTGLRPAYGTYAPPHLNETGGVKVRGELDAMVMSTRKLTGITDSQVVANLNADMVDGQHARNFAVAGFASLGSAGTPIFDAAAVSTFKIVLIANVSSSALIHGSAGQNLSFIICQDAIGNHTFKWPTNVKGGMVIGMAPTKCSVQSFVCDGTVMYATSGGAVD